MEKIKTKLVLAAMAAILMMGYVSAGDWVDAGGLDITDTTTFTPTADNDTTEGGNITTMNISQELQTDKWAAYYGNLTGTISLRESTGTYSVFNWAWSVASGAEVCAIADGSDFNWANVAGSTSTEVDEVDTRWSFTGTDTDSANNTFGADATTETFDIAGASGLTAESFVTGPGVDNDTFRTGLLEDQGGAAKEDYAFCVNTDVASGCTTSGGCSYNGQPANYELMVPTNATATATELYYFYVELN